MGRKHCEKRRNCSLRAISPSFSHSVFKWLVSKGRQKVSLCGNELTLYHTIPTFNDPEGDGFFDNIVGKAENAGNQHFLIFPQCFLPLRTLKSFFFFSRNLSFTSIQFVICNCFQFGPV